MFIVADLVSLKHGFPLFSGLRGPTWIEISSISLLVYASSEGSDETVQMRRRVRAFADRICNKYQNLKHLLKYAHF